MVQVVLVEISTRVFFRVKILKKQHFSNYSKNEKIVEKFFIYSKNIVFKRLTPIANGGKIVKLRIKD